ncbi:MAG TPA: TetR/AcrR family transcriptional regulator [Pseudonocardiaceae bacterium]|nr:TetR/AcrR family transcriptional regulator [Pseudonocardiaceae bacterium]
MSYHHGDLCDAILDAAETLVRERGADGWSLREVSARIGVSPSAAYHHFRSRDDLVSTLSHRVLASLGQRLRHAVQHVRGDDPLQRLIALGRGYVHWVLDDPAVAALAFRARHTQPATPIFPHPQDVLDEELDRLGLPEAARDGADFLFWAAIHGEAMLLAEGLVKLDSNRAVDRHTERLVRALLTGIAQEPASVDRPKARSAYTERRG